MPQFDAASVKTSADAKNQEPRIDVSPTTLSMRNVTVTYLIQWAYHASLWQISGPDWMDSLRYDVIAKAKDPVSADEMRRMLQTLLAERFKLVLHRETKQLSVLELFETKAGHKLKKAKGDGPSQFSKGATGASFRHVTLAEFADRLSRDARMPVLDQTGLAGYYDFFIDPRSYNPPQRPDGQRPDVLEMMQVLLPEQLGLRLELHKASVELLVIDNLQKSPGEN